MLFTVVVVVVGACLYGIAHLILYILRRKQEGDRIGILSGLFLILVVALFGIWVTHFLVFRVD